MTIIFNVPDRESLGTYLGSLVFQVHPSESTFQEIINKTTMKLEGWDKKIVCLNQVEQL